MCVVTNCFFARRGSFCLLGIPVGLQLGLTAGDGDGDGAMDWSGERKGHRHNNKPTLARRLQVRTPYNNGTTSTEFSPGCLHWIRFGQDLILSSRWGVLGTQYLYGVLVMILINQVLVYKYLPIRSNTLVQGRQVQIYFTSTPYGYRVLSINRDSHPRLGSFWEPKSLS